jgi:hypothetical protein
MDRHERHADPSLADSASRLAQRPLGVTLDIKLLIFRQLSWREYFFPFGFSRQFLRKWSRKKNYARLRALKNCSDAKDAFRFTHQIAPASRSLMGGAKREKGNMHEYPFSCVWNRGDWSTRWSK